MLEAELKMSMGGQAVRTGHTVGSVVAGYIAARDGGDLKPDTLAFYRAGERSIPPVFSARRASTVNPMLIKSLYKELRAKGTTQSVLRRLHSTLSASFSRAVALGWMTNNPCASVKKPTTKAPEVVPPTPGEVKRLIAAAVKVNPDLSVAFLLLAATGMRRSEVVGLQWRDRTGDGSIIVRRNRVRDGNEFKTSDTKTGTRGHRTIVVDTDTLGAVEQVRQRQDASGRLCDWIFTHDGLEPFRPEYLTHSYANLQTDGTSVHDLRHWLPAEDQTSADLIAAILH